MVPDMGLRERKKEQTRQLIAQTAWRLFADRGFDGVTVAEVARQAEVAVATVFNYFPTKEDLFYERLEAFEARLMEAVATRAAGESGLGGFPPPPPAPGGASRPGGRRVGAGGLPPPPAELRWAARPGRGR